MLLNDFFHFLTTTTFLGRDKDVNNGEEQSARQSAGQRNPDENEATGERGTFFSLFNIILEEWAFIRVVGYNQELHT